MYIRRIRIYNYGPIEDLDIEFPFHDDAPKPIILVGANGSGKTIMLSHIVNSLLTAQSVAYQYTPEIPDNKIYKLMSPHYIRLGAGFSYACLDFDGDFSTQELCCRTRKGVESALPPALEGTVPLDLWNKLSEHEANVFGHNGNQQDTHHAVGSAYRGGCAQYFPSYRGENPAWLNPHVLDEHAAETNFTNFAGETNRLLVNERSMRANRDWLIGVLFDKHALDIQLQTRVIQQGTEASLVNVLAGYTGDANQIYDAALTILRAVTGKEGTRFGIGRRNARVVSLFDGDVMTVPNIFQLSSGEMMLLDIGFSIMRDFDWSEPRFRNLNHVSGIVVIDEVDLHLHMRLQRTVLPRLLKLFPNVQFVVTTHSPFFVLGMQEALGDGGFEIRRMPDGDLISPEEFSEFESAYAVIAESDRFSSDLQNAVESSSRPILVVEGRSDIEYLRKAAGLLSRAEALDLVELHDGNGAGSMRNYWKGCTERMATALGRQVLLLFDCDEKLGDNSIFEKGNLVRRVTPRCSGHPVPKGIENRFTRATLERARATIGTWFDIEEEHGVTIDGVPQTVPESWTVPNRHKMALCGWLCEQGTSDDFAHFGEIFDLVEEALGDTPAETE